MGKKKDTKHPVFEYLSKIDTVGVLLTSNNEKKNIELSCELKYRLDKKAQDKQKIFLSRFVCVSSGVPITSNNHTGQLGITGTTGSGWLLNEQNQFKCTLHFETFISYDMIRKKLGYEQISDDQFVIPEEKFSGHLEGIIKTEKNGNEVTKYYFSDGNITLNYLEGGLGLIRTIIIPITNIIIIDIFAFLRNHPCYPLVTFQRTMSIQPVGFGLGNERTGTSALRQFLAAKKAWGKCCIHLDFKPFIYIDALKKEQISNMSRLEWIGPLSNAVEDNILDSYDDQNPSVIEVFFVESDVLDNDLGSGQTYGSGQVQAKVILSDNNMGCDNLLAHELGHVLGGKHPGTLPEPGRWIGDFNTVLQQYCPIPGENTRWNCTQADNPALSTNQNIACCFSHDCTDHFIRDFPEDIGIEPSIAPNNRNYYSSSHIWNRIVEHPGFATSDGPMHQEPIRLTRFHQPYKNYIYAVIEAINDLPARDVVVDFHLLFGGFRGRDATDIFLGRTPVSSSLKPSNPKLVRLDWNVPEDAPQDCYLVAIVNSPSEPKPSISGNVFQWGYLVRSDNDIAIRKISILD
jgi:hypothetical protein